MKAASAPSASSPFFLATLTLLVGIGLTTGCGSNGTTPLKLSGNTSVTVLLASTGNDQVTRFAVGFETLTLTSQSGKTVTLSSSQQPSEFMHLNGGIEPLTTVSVPQDIYISATATLGGICLPCASSRRRRDRQLFNYQSRPDCEFTLTNHGHGQQHGVTAEHAGFQFGSFSHLLDDPSI